MPLPQSAVLGASDLPRTVLSDHIEERLFKRLKLERQARASQSGRSFDEVSEISLGGSACLLCLCFSTISGTIIHIGIVYYLL